MRTTHVPLLIIATGLGGCAMNERQVEQVTRNWIEVWNHGDPTTLPLAEDFQHTSPYGHIEGRQRYLDWVLPLAGRNVADLTVEDVIVQGNRSVVRYRNRLSSGHTMRACDWLTFANGKITHVRAYYERPAENRDGANDATYE